MLNRRKLKRKIQHNTPIVIPVLLMVTLIVLYQYQAWDLGLVLLLGLLLVVLLLVELRHRLLRTLAFSQEKHYRRVESLFSLYHSVQSDMPPLPDMHGWAASPDFLKVLVRLIYQNRPTTIVELGSGASTFICANVLRNLKHGKILSFDNNESYANQTQEQLELHGLADYASVTYAGLKETTLGGEKWMWYDTDKFKDIDKIDLLTVDGPPARTQRFARYPAVPVLFDKLADNALILLDDAKREEETAITKRWQQEFASLEGELLRLERGAYLLRKKTKS